MATTLRLTKQDPNWNLLSDLLSDDDRWAWNDNGGEPDGNAWLPMDTVSGDEALAVVAAGEGEMVEVMYANDEAMARFLGMNPLPDDDGNWLDEVVVDQMQAAAEDKTAGWAHYGAYGSGDGSWVYIPRT
jgi:hypothetical protein